MKERDNSTRIYTMCKLVYASPLWLDHVLLDIDRHYFPSIFWWRWLLPAKRNLLWLVVKQDDTGLQREESVPGEHNCHHRAVSASARRRSKIRLFFTSSSSTVLVVRYYKFCVYGHHMRLISECTHLSTVSCNVVAALLCTNKCDN